MATPSNTPGGPPTELQQDGHGYPAQMDALGARVQHLTTEFGAPSGSTMTPTVLSNATAAASQPPPVPAPTPVAVPTRPVPLPVPPLDTYTQQSFGALLNSKVKQSRVLMVGAGGIGCELLKNLVLSGFGHIEIVDLDTIDLSNLNRQFLFRYEHIKKPKAFVAKEMAQTFDPSARMVAHHANIKEPQFSISWFRQFSIVFNALDNLEARRHVNRMCLGANVPLIESGTTGFNGQVQVIKKGVTACYECDEKPVVKSYPVCTIRSTPSQPIHCIVWGKDYLLNEIFGISEDESAFDHQADSDNASEIEELKREAAALREIRQSAGTESFPQMLFDKVFNSDIHRLRSMEDMWKSRRPPEPLQYETVKAQAESLAADKTDIVRAGQKVWSLEENFIVFVDSLDRLSKRMVELKRARDEDGPEPLIAFDKDDEDTLDFVAASANIRAALFGIEAKSRFDIKEAAGNIVPAIATTNAISAGLCVLEGLKVLKGDYANIKEIYMMQAKSNRLLGASPPRRPNPLCSICSIYQASAAVDLSRATLGDLVDNLVRLELGFGEKEFVVNVNNELLYDVEETENLGRKLTELGITAGSMLTIIDETDADPYVNVVINVEELSDAESSGKIVKLYGQHQPEVPRRPRPAKPAKDVAADASTVTASTVNGHDGDDDDLVLVDTAPSRKRVRADDEDDHTVKRSRVIKPSQGNGAGAEGKPNEASNGSIIILDD